MELNTSQIAQHFGLTVPGTFIAETLQIPPDRRDKRAMFWDANRIPKIADALSEYILERGKTLPSEASDLF